MYICCIFITNAQLFDKLIKISNLSKDPFNHAVELDKQKASLLTHISFCFEVCQNCFYIYKSSKSETG